MIDCQFTIYPLCTSQVGEVLEAALGEISTIGLEIKIGKMSTGMQGEGARVFAAQQSAYNRVAKMGDVVMTVTVSSACGA